jgi:phosphoglycolate phosphatase-like HAD superfamily hydrolase
MVELLHDLHRSGCKIGLVTGKTVTTAEISLRVFGIADLFSGVEGGSLRGVVKAECIGSLAAAWGLDPDRVAYVGDTAMDVAEARKAGVTAVSAAWSDFADREALVGAGPDAVFDDVPSFARWLRAQGCSGVSAD